MQKTILLTGATDGIGSVAAKLLVEKGHHVLLHGRNPGKLATIQAELEAVPGEGRVEGFIADFANMDDVLSLAADVSDKHSRLDVLINNAGVYRTSRPITGDNLDVRFVVNTIAPYVLTQKLLPMMDTTGRVVNLSSAAQAPVDLDALAGSKQLPDNAAYAQSKLAITMWTALMAQTMEDGPAFIALNPGSLLATKMVKEAFGIEGSDIRIGANIIVEAALADTFHNASGKYFDNDARRFAPPHPDALNQKKSEAVLKTIEAVIKRIL